MDGSKKWRKETKNDGKKKGSKEEVRRYLLLHYVCLSYNYIVMILLLHLQHHMLINPLSVSARSRVLVALQNGA